MEKIHLSHAVYEPSPQQPPRKLMDPFPVKVTVISMVEEELATPELLLFIQ